MDSIVYITKVILLRTNERLLLGHDGFFQKIKHFQHYSALMLKLKIMDNQNKAISPFGDLINMNENYEVEYWASRFDVKPEVLKNAVLAVGNSAVAVEKYLKGK